MLGFAGGYLAVGTHSQRGAVYWFSDDGREWQRGVLAETTADCSGEPTYDAYVSGAASDGHGLIVTGKQFVFNSETCGDPDAGVGGGLLSWTSIDGRNWTRSESFGHRHAIMSRPWTTPDGGFEGLADSWDMPTALWQSADGIEWTQAASFPEMHGWSGAAAISAKGVRLLASRTADDRHVLLSSTNGRDWTALASAPDIPAYAEIISLLHVRHNDEWVVITVGEPTGSVIYSSSDLSSWSRTPFPQPRFIRSIAVGPTGYVVSAERQDRYDIACDGIGCPGPSERQYLSVDGLEWTQVAPRISEGALFAEGPAGLIAVGLYGGEVWLLEP